MTTQTTTPEWLNRLFMVQVDINATDRRKAESALYSKVGSLDDMAAIFNCPKTALRFVRVSKALPHLFSHTLPKGSYWGDLPYIAKHWITFVWDTFQHPDRPADKTAIIPHDVFFGMENQDEARFWVSISELQDILNNTDDDDQSAIQNLMECKFLNRWATTQDKGALYD